MEMGYYQECPLAKPGTERKKKKSNGYKNKVKRFCYYHGTAYAERHEVFGGSNRQTSIDNGWQVDLCPECHREVTQNTKKGLEINSCWRQKYQKEYEEKLIDSGISRYQAREMWIALIGKSYL